MRLQATRGTGGLAVAVALGAAVAAAPSFRAMHQPDSLRPGPGVTGTRMLSAYLPALAGTAGDTPVFELAGADPGGAVLVLGGTHGDEPAGYLAAIVLVERARIHRGRLLVIPRANASGFTHNIAQEGHPQRFMVKTPGGPRSFTYGARASNPVHQWPDPQVTTLAGSGQKLAGIETRNLNRAYPGRAEGTLTEQIAFAITSLIRQERIDLAIDLHEAAPEYPVVNTIVAHERAADLAALANLNLQAAGIVIGLEGSPANLHGLSHREWGDATATLAVLVETTNPAQGRLRGRTDSRLVTSGQDRFYERAAAENRLSVPFSIAGWPLEVRVARHLATIAELVAGIADGRADRAVELAGVPAYEEMVAQGLGAFLAESTAPAEARGERFR
ncbi:MAG: succinylglutamate desuccinylase/aspartoacylase family protein [Acidobacteriota bacterium]